MNQKDISKYSNSMSIVIQRKHLIIGGLIGVGLFTFIFIKPILFVLKWAVFAGVSFVGYKIGQRIYLKILYAPFVNEVFDIIKARESKITSIIGPIDEPWDKKKPQIQFSTGPMHGGYGPKAILFSFSLGGPDGIGRIIAKGINMKDPVRYSFIQTREIHLECIQNLNGHMKKNLVEIYVHQNKGSDIIDSVVVEDRTHHNKKKKKKKKKHNIFVISKKKFIF